MRFPKFGALAHDLAGVETRRMFAFALAYWAALFLSLQLRLATGGSAIWLIEGVLANGLLMLPSRLRAPLIAFCALGGLAVTWATTGPLSSRFLVMLSLNLVECVLLAWSIRRVCGPKPDFSRWRQLLLLSALVLPISLTFATAGAYALKVVGIGGPPPSLWFQSHALGAMLVTPAVSILSRPRRYRVFTISPIELFAVMGGFSLLALGVFLGDKNAPVLFLLFPMMMVLAFRYGPVGASLGVLATGLLAAHFSLQAPSVPIETMGMDRIARIQMLQVFVAVLFFTALPVAGAVTTSARMRALLARRTLIARVAREKAERASHARAEFLANMSHEIRTPLNGVLGLADALWRTDLRADQRDMLKMILTSGKALTGLLSDALDLARADSGNMEIAQEPFDVRLLIEEAAFPFEHLAQAKGLQFEIAFNGEIPRASVGDPLRIRQILANLVSNAIKFTSAGSVTLAVACDKTAEGARYLRVSVKDTGIGLDRDMRSRLFRRFEQGDSSVTRRFGGCGLGLSIAHKLAEMMGGELECVSSPGVGSTFTLYLPVADTLAAPEPAPATEPAVLAGQRKLSVLLAEDHPVNQKVVQIILGDEVQLTIVADGQAAVEAAHAAVFDAILMDTHMPVMDGLSAIRLIREWETRSGRPRTPIISLTADAMPQQIATAMAAGADLHLSKPITGDSLVRTLQESQTLGRAAEPPIRQAG